jgi:hypothetical protein
MYNWPVSRVLNPSCTLHLDEYFSQLCTELYARLADTTGSLRGDVCRLISRVPPARGCRKEAVARAEAGSDPVESIYVGVRAQGLQRWRIAVLSRCYKALSLSFCLSRAMNSRRLSRSPSL